MPPQPARSPSPSAHTPRLPPFESPFISSLNRRPTPRTGASKCTKAFRKTPLRYAFEFCQSEIASSSLLEIAQNYQLRASAGLDFDVGRILIGFELVLPKGPPFEVYLEFVLSSLNVKPELSFWVRHRLIRLFGTLYFDSESSHGLAGVANPN